jgi:hypothetical protein
MGDNPLQQPYGGFRFPACFFEFANLFSVLENRGVDLRESLNIVPAEIFSSEHVSDPWKAARYPNDPPEFFTLLHGMSDGLHWGYYIGNENDPAILVVSYYHRDPLHFSIDGLNLHEALRSHLEACWRDNLDYMSFDDDPVYEERQRQLQIIRETIKAYATADREETGTAYLERYQLSAKPGIPLRYGIDIDPAEGRYQPLKNAENWLSPGYIPAAGEVRTAVAEAEDLLREGYITALKLGRDLWCYEGYRSEAIRLLEKAYTVLKRPRALALLERISGEPAE